MSIRTGGTPSAPAGRFACLYGTCFGAVTVCRTRRSGKPAPTAGPRSSRYEDPGQPSDLTDPALGQPVGSYRRRYALLVGDREHPFGRVEDLRSLGLGPVEVEALDLVRDLDQTTGVHHIVRGIEDAALGHHLLDALMRELVVRRTTDDLRGQYRHGVVVERTAESAGREDVQIGANQRIAVGGHLDLGMFDLDPVDRRVRHIGDQHLSAVFDQVPDEMMTDLAHPGHAYPPAVEARVAPDRLRGRAHALEDAIRGQNRRV